MRGRANGWKRVLLLLCASVVLEGVQAQTDPAATERYGEIVRLRGDVTATGHDGATRALHEGDSIYAGDRVAASGAGEALIRTEDAGMVGVRPGAEFRIEAYSAQGRTSDHVALRLFTGTLRIITGWIGHLNARGVKVETPSATIGIRGTDHEPYVLPPEAAGPDRREGSYDKVNRGATVLSLAGHDLDVPAGRVGFAPAAGMKTRGLITVLLPTLLERVPDFYVPGQFEADLDAFSANADATSAAALAARQGQASGTPVAPLTCAPRMVAAAWLKQLDDSIDARDSAAFIALFAPDVAVQATVRSADGTMSRLTLTRDELAKSALTALSGLTDYEQKRLKLVVRTQAMPGAACPAVLVRSWVSEHGKMDGKPYRFDTVENYRLEWHDGRWVATRAETLQR